MEKAVVVLPAEEEHISGIISVWKELMDFHAEIDPFYSRSTDGHVHFKQLIKEYIYSETAYIVVALYGETVVGYGTCQIHSLPPVFKEKQCGMIADCAVTSSYRRQGIGENILHAMYEWFQEKGISRIQLRVAIGNRVGYSFWKKQGFEECIHILYRILE